MPVFLGYLGVIAIWTTTPLAIKWSGEADWFFGIVSRLGLASILILPLVLFFSQHKLDLSFSALKVYFYAALSLLGGMTPVYWAAQTMPSSWIALLWGLNPIVTGLMAYWLIGKDKLTASKLLGIALSFSGLILIFAPNLDGNLQLAGVLVTTLGVFFHSLSTVLVKKTQHNLPPMHVATGALWMTSLVYLIIQPTIALPPYPELSSKALITLFYLVTIGSVFGFALYYYVLKHYDAMRLGMIPMITPVFALMLGYFANDELLNPSIIAGTLVVILGLILFDWKLFRKVISR